MFFHEPRRHAVTGLKAESGNAAAPLYVRENDTE